MSFVCHTDQSIKFPSSGIPCCRRRSRHIKWESDCDGHSSHSPLLLYLFILSLSSSSQPSMYICLLALSRYGTVSFQFPLLTCSLVQFHHSHSLRSLPQWPQQPYAPYPPAIPPLLPMRHEWVWCRCPAAFCTGHQCLQRWPTLLCCMFTFSDAPLSLTRYP